VRDGAAHSPRIARSTWAGGTRAQGRPYTHERPGFTAHTSPGVPGQLEVDQRLRRVSVGPHRRADDRDRAWVQEPGEVHGASGAYAPRRGARVRAMIISYDRWDIGNRVKLGWHPEHALVLR
jgi:hypothetical protein